MVDTPKKNKNDRGIFIWIFLGLLLLFILWWLFSGEKTTGGGGGGVVPSTCNPSLWTSKPIILPESFTADFTGYDECAAQTYGQNNNKQAFILCKDGGVMFLSGGSFTGTETACADCKIYYTKDFTATLTPEVTVPPYSDIPENTACPLRSYGYCDEYGSTIEQVYITSSCGASTNLVNKLISEGKLSGFDDPKIIKCCQNPEVCIAANITKYPTVICSNDTHIRGFCP